MGIEGETTNMEGLQGTAAWPVHCTMNVHRKPRVVTHACESSTWEVEEGELGV